MKTDLALFEDYKIRRVYDGDTENCWFSGVHIQVVTQQKDFQAARNKLTDYHVELGDVPWSDLGVADWGNERRVNPRRRPYG